MERHLTILHTSDWHIGRTLYGRRRHNVFAAFLDWLATTLRERRVDVLVVAGDVFDTSSPGTQAQELYYRFLCDIMHTCRHIVIVAGNHDSPSFLTAPQGLLRALNVHVVGTVDDPELLVLRDDAGEPELIVCAVPYLRDRDIRLVAPGESIEDKERRMVEGIRRHYLDIAEQAERLRTSPGLPVLATGHLFAAGGQTTEGDGVRQLYVGSLAQVGADCFPETFDYLALGHLHLPQLVGGSETRRYSGAPIPMNFGERGGKSVCLVTLAGRQPSVECLPVPEFQALERIEGPWESIESRLQKLHAPLAETAPWVEIVYTGNECIPDLRERIEALVQGTGVEILRIRNARAMSQALERENEETLDTLDVHEVFERCLTAHEIPEEQRPDLRLAYREIVTSLQEEE